MLERLIATLRDEQTGGLLALPVVDTSKRGDADGYVLQTEPREHLWQAQTPQMFRYRAAARGVARDRSGGSDRRSAARSNSSACGRKLVMGDTRNLKVTYPQDLELAELILKSMEDA